MRAAVAVSPEIASAIDRYFLAVERNTSDAERIPALAGNTVTRLQILRRIAENGATPDDILVDQLKASTEAFERAENDWNQDRTVLGNCIVELATKWIELDQNCPSTQHNEMLFEQFERSIERYKAEYAQMTEPFRQRDQANQNRVIESMAKMSGKDSTLADHLRGTVELEELYGNYMSLDFHKFSIGEAQVYARLGDEFHQLLRSRLDSKGEDWRFSSERGFTIDFPAGWELEVYPPAPGRLSEKGLKKLEEFNTDCHNLGCDFEATLRNDTISNGVGGMDFVRLKIVTRGGQGLVGTMTEAERTDKVPR